MRNGVARALFVAAASLWLAGCSADKFSNPFESKTPGADAFAAAPANDGTTAEPTPPLGALAADPGLLGSDPNDALSLGKKHYRANDFGLAEKYFRHAAELHPRDAEVWLGLAASYDRLRRFDLADRAYGQAIGILGPTTEILNNQGYSYMLRGDYKRARAKLATAQRQDPGNRYVQNNIQLLEDSARKGKAIE
ncbi:MAG TPA: tetratricopeptide repeat protein [Pseudolabrys sp.]|jgi:Flp pilus assembly protein TadD|nr:tetratricopeptide repeat protein [Pseudolabrys sp.]